VGKREKLVDAAVALAYRQGYRKTTLADIAEESGVPLGNVYYYYKTKDDIGEAIVQHREGQFAALRERLDVLPTPGERLCAYVDVTINNAPNVAQSGCPMGSLCAELLKEGGPLAERSNALMAEPMAWMERQFEEMGHARDAADFALQFQAALQGASLLTQSFRDPTLLQREGNRLKSWLGSLAATQ
jgi:TetR/AcrR family transcriptional regulator, transcriptional repressor for nem operon